MAENFPQDKSEQGEKDRNNKLSRIQKMLASLLKRERGVLYELTEDTISAKSAIQFLSTSSLLTAISDDDDE